MIITANKRVFKCFYSLHLKLMNLFLVARMKGIIMRADDKSQRHSPIQRAYPFLEIDIPVSALFGFWE